MFADHFSWHTPCSVDCHRESDTTRDSEMHANICYCENLICSSSCFPEERLRLFVADRREEMHGMSRKNKTNILMFSHWQAAGKWRDSCFSCWEID